MIPLLTREEARRLDADAEKHLGIPTLLLMENAGRGAFELLCARYPDVLSRVAILGGVGQNGGDAWVVARHLWLGGQIPRCVLLGDRSKVRGDARINLELLERIGVAVAVVAADSDPALAAALSGATLIVDGLFGTGLDRPVTGLYADVIARINAAAVPRVALDIPSGVDADTGAVLGIAVEAAHTVTFASHKRGLHQHPGAGLSGQLSCASIGVPAPQRAACMQLEAADVASWVPRRAPTRTRAAAGTCS